MGIVGFIENQPYIVTGSCGYLMRLASSSIRVALLLLEPLTSTSCVHHAAPHGCFDLFHLIVSPVWFYSYGSTWTVQLVRPSQPSPHSLRLALCPCSLLGRACTTHCALPHSCHRVSVFGRCELYGIHAITVTAWGGPASGLGCTASARPPNLERVLTRSKEIF